MRSALLILVVFFTVLTSSAAAAQATGSTTLTLTVPTSAALMVDEMAARETAGRAGFTTVIRDDREKGTATVQVAIDQHQDHLTIGCSTVTSASLNCRQGAESNTSQQNAVLTSRTAPNASVATQKHDLAWQLTDEDSLGQDSQTSITFTLSGV